MESSTQSPFWGPQTSYLNFCEEDYMITRYVAEFVNTLSSFVYILYGIHGIMNLRAKQQATITRLIPYFGLMGVGVCSAGYHMTLKYHTQMSDELSMHLLTTPLLHRLLTFKTSPRHTKLISTFLLIEFTTVMVAHMVLDEFLLHAITFGFGVFLIAARLLTIIPGEISDASIRADMRKLALFGCSCFIFGYMVWLVDEWACSHLTSIRHFVGAPLAFLFELHGWWHVFTAIGGYIAVALVDIITSGETLNDPAEQLAWPLPLASKLLGLTPETKKD